MVEGDSIGNTMSPSKKKKKVSFASTKNESHGRHPFKEETFFPSFCLTTC